MIEPKYSPTPCAMNSALNSQEWTDRLTPKPSSDLSKVRQLYLGLYEAIARGDLHFGLTLPTSRALSQQLGLGRNTVIAAYAQLESEGLIHSEGRRGTRVTYQRKHEQSPSSINSGAASLSRRAMASTLSKSAFSDLAPGMPDPSLFPAEGWRKAMRKAGSLSASHLGYAPNPLPELQQAIARYLSIYRSLSVDPEQILITSGTRQSLLVAATLYADPGDHAWVECPGYPGAVDAFKTAGLELKAMPVDNDGANIINDNTHSAPALIYLTPCFHYPTGTALAMHRRDLFLEYSAAHGAVLFEDDYDSEFRDNSEARPALASQHTQIQGNPHTEAYSTGKNSATTEQHGINATVLHAGTFSKLIFPAARVAWLVLPKEHITRGHACLKALGGGHNRIAQAVITELLENGSVSRHLHSARRIYSQRRAALISSLNQSDGFLPIEESGGSLSLVARLTHGVSATRFKQLCDQHQLGIQIFEDFEWNTQQTDQVSALVLGVGNISTLAVSDAVERLQSVLTLCMADSVSSTH